MSEPKRTRSAPGTARRVRSPHGIGPPRARPAPSPADPDDPDDTDVDRYADALELIDPERVGTPQALLGLLEGPDFRAYLSAVRAALAPDAGTATDVPALPRATFRAARLAARSLVSDVERLLLAGLRVCREPGYAPRFEDARAWHPRERARLLGALVRVAAYDAADTDVLRRFIALADHDLGRGEPHPEGPA